MWQVLEPRPHRVAEVERHVLYDEEVVCRSSRMACESEILEPCVDGTPARPRSDYWCEAKLSTCCAVAASSSAFSY
jgi:hypothetical protein